MRMVYLWKDTYDKDVFSVGTKLLIGGLACHGQLYIDGITAMFGSEVYDKCRSAAPGELIAVRIEAKLDEEAGDKEK